MKLISTLFFILTLTVLLFNNCTRKEVKTRTLVVSENNLSSKDIIADTIVYSVDMVAINPDDEWEAWRLRNMNTTDFVQEVFKKVYNKKITAYDYFTEAELTINDVKAIEASDDYARENIEEIQFEEIWLFSPDEQIFHKEIISFVLGYALYSEEGQRIGLKPVFRIKMNQD